ncbi:MAG: RDD family protein [Pseudomonadota bacterium]
MKSTEAWRLRSARRWGFVLDAFGYSVLLFVFYFVFVGVPLLAMGDYDEVQRYLYLIWTPAAYIFFFAQHVIAHSLLEASFGQFVLGLAYRSADGERPLFINNAKRALISTLIFPTLLLLPGPVIGFLFGPDSALVSLVALAIGFAAAIRISLNIDGDGRTLTERATGLSLTKTPVGRT